MGLLLPPPISTHHFLLLPGSAKALKMLLTTHFAKMALITSSALKVQEPFTTTSHYCKNDPHYSSNPKSARALHKS